MSQKIRYTALLLTTILLVSCEVTFTSTTSAGGDPTPVSFAPFVTEPPIPPAESGGSGSFSPANANSVAPDSVLEEVAYFAAGGDESCLAAGEPEPQGVPENVEWVQSFVLITCGWNEGEEVAITFIDPSGNSTSQRTIARTGSLDLSPSIIYFITPSSVGQYQYIFDGENTVLTVTVPVYKPFTPRMYVWSDNNKVVLYSLKPNENVRLLAYSVDSAAGTIKLEGWEEFQADSDGTLVVNIPDTFFVYFAIGENSGYLKDQNSNLRLDGSILR